MDTKAKNWAETARWARRLMVRALGISGHSLPGSLLGGGIGGLFVVGGSGIQLGPYAAPVVGEHQLTGNLAAGELLDCGAVRNRHRPLSADPSGHDRLFQTKVLREALLSPSLLIKPHRECCHVENY